MINVSCSKQILLNQKQMLINAFEPLLKNKSVIFFDVPIHNNVGDSLISLGTYELFSCLNVNVLDAVSIYEYDRISKISPCKDTVLVCQGGGNFGDIYPRHQSLRMFLIESFPDNNIVFMPQSVFYYDESLLDFQCDKIKSHKGAYLFVRDLNSYELLKLQGVSSVELVPDVATMLVETTNFSNAGSGNGIFNLLRKDEESVNSSLVTYDHSVDWVDIISQTSKLYLYIFRYLIKKNNRLNISKLTLCLSKILYKRLAGDAVRYFSSFECVKTDRLHAMILSQLLGKECQSLDNSYGKLLRYRELWY